MVSESVSENNDSINTDLNDSNVFPNHKIFFEELKKLNEMCFEILKRADQTDPERYKGPLEYDNQMVNNIKRYVTYGLNHLKIRVSLLNTLYINKQSFKQYDTLSNGECIPGALSVLIFGHTSFHAITRLMVCYSLLRIDNMRGRSLTKQRKGFKIHAAYIDDTDLKHFGDLFGFNIENYYFDRNRNPNEKIKTKFFDIKANHTISLMWSQNADGIYHINPLFINY